MSEMHTTAEVAMLLGSSRRTVTRVARNLGLAKIASVYLFSKADVEKLKSTIRSGPGNPNFGTSKGHRENERKVP